MNVMVDDSSSDRKDSKRDADASTELKKAETNRDVGGGSFELTERSSDGRSRDLGKVPSMEAGVDVRFTLRTSLLVLTCTAAMILNIASATVVSIALPTIGRHFNVGPDELQWLVSAFSLSSGCLLIFFGRLADLHGRKKAFLIGTTWLGIFSLACGFANSIVALDVLRGLQGLGAAATIPASLGILAHAFPPSRARSIAFATFSAGAPVGGAVGTQIGGVLTQYASTTWRAPFFLTTGLSALVLLGGMYSIDADRAASEFIPDEERRVDWLGAVLVTVGLVLVTFVLGQGTVAENGWRTPYIIALLILGIIFIAAFLYWQHFLEVNQRLRSTSRLTIQEQPTLKSSQKRSPLRARLPPPLMKLSLWTRANGKFAVMQSIAFLEWASFLSWTFWAQLYYQDYEGLSPVLTAVRLLPMMIVGVMCNFFVAMVVGHVGLVYLVVAGTTLTGIASLLFALINPSSPYWAFGFPAAALSVFGADFVFACGALFVAKVSMMDEQSVAGGLFQTLMQLGTAFGLAITTIVHNSVLRHESAVSGVSLDPTAGGGSREMQLKAYKAAQWTGFGFAMLGAALALVFLRGVGVVGHRRIKHVVSEEEGSSVEDERESENKQ